MATLEEAAVLKLKLQGQHKGKLWYSGIGITPQDEGYGVRINVAPAQKAPSFSDSIDGIPVEVVVVSYEKR